MSFIFRDMLGPAKALQQHFSSTRQAFKSVWPLSDDGLTYSKSLTFYENGNFRTDKKFTKFLKALGISIEEFTKQSVDSEIEKMFFVLTEGFKWDGSEGFTGVYKAYDWGDTSNFNPTPSLVNPTTTQIVEGVHEVFTTGDEITITISYGGELKRYIEEHELSWVATGIEVIAGPLDTETIRNKILSDPWYYIVNSRHLDYTKDSNQFQTYDSPNYIVPKDVYRPSNRTLPTCDTAIALKGYELQSGGVKEPNLGLGIFALMAEDSDWEPILNDEGINLYNTNTSTITSGDNRLEGEILKYTFDLKFKFKATTNTSKYIKEMVSWYDKAFVNLYELPIKIITSTSVPDTYKAERTTSIIDTKPKHAMARLRTDPSNGTNSLYTNGLLIVDVVNRMKAKDFARLLGNQLDTSYTVKEASFLEKVIGLVIIVAAIIVGVMLAVPSGGTSLITLGSGLAAASGILSLGMMALSAFGGLSATGIVKQIGAFATIIGYTSMLVGLAVAWQAASRAALETAKTAAITTAEEVAGEVLTDVAKEAILDKVTITTIDVVKDIVSNMFNNLIGFGSDATTTVLSSAKEALNLAMNGFEVYKSIDQEELQGEISALEDEYKELSDELDSSRRLADPLFVLLNSQEELGSYDALSMLDTEWRANKSPQGFFDSFESERSIT